jgi:hypothetical protein
MITNQKIIVMTNLINLTNTPITIGGTTFPPSGGAIQLMAFNANTGQTAMGLPIIRQTFVTATGLPEPQEGTFFIVEPEIQAAMPTRSDLLTAIGGETPTALGAGEHFEWHP